MADDVPADVKNARVRRLQALVDATAAAVSESMVGSLQRVLVTGPSRRDPSELAARTSNNRVVNFAGATRLVGRIIDIEITEARAHTLRGVVPGSLPPQLADDPAGASAGAVR
jgi:tRNA-2-methylthio-N6-dimethylallyladenosine synthase